MLGLTFSFLSPGEVKKDARSDSEGESTVDEQLTVDSEDVDETGDSDSTTEVNSNVIKLNGNAYHHLSNGDCALRDDDRDR